MTIREAISRVKKIFREVNADSRFTNKLAYSLLKSAAKQLIKRENDKLKIYPQNTLFQFYKCIDVIEAPLIDPCCGLRTKCKVWRTKEKMPKIYDDIDGPIIKNTYSIDGSKELEFTTPERYMQIKNNPWVKDHKEKYYYYYSEGYLYFPSRAFHKVMLFAYFEDDLSGICQTSETDNNCKKYMDSLFRIPGYLEKPIFDLVEQEVANLYAKLREKGHQIDKNDNTLNILN